MLLMPIRSTLVDDPAYAELVSEFVANIPVRVHSIRQSMDRNDAKQLCTLVHQLKGACGSYGFHEITPLASAIEDQIALGTEVSSWIPAIELLVATCLRMTADRVERL